MLYRVTAYEVIRQAKSGRTRPVLMLCEAETDRQLEVFCKLSAGCDEGVASLAREVVAACLAADLKLPVPTPYLVEIPSALASVVTSPGIAKQLQASSPVGFGSAKVEGQFSVWTTGNRVTNVMLPSALGALVFDAVIENSDRRASNPNCLVARNDIRLIDHELSFPPISGILNRQPSWQLGALRWLDHANGHIFVQKIKKIKKRRLEFGPLRALWSAISDDRLLEYRDAIPSEWDKALPTVDDALDRVRNARDNFDGVITEIRRILQ